MRLIPDGILSPRNVLERLAKIDIDDIDDGDGTDRCTVNPRTANTWAANVALVHGAVGRRK